MGCTQSQQRGPPPQRGPPRQDELLYVLIPFFNPAGFKRREELFHITVAHVLENPHVRLVTAELKTAPGEPSVSYQQPEQDRYVERISCASPDVLWAKEQLINLAAKVAIDKHGAVNIAWIDADIHFNWPTWAQDTVTTLQPNPRNGSKQGSGVAWVAQMFATADLEAADGSVAHRVTSFGAQYNIASRGGKKQWAWQPRTSNDSKEYWHPGFAWATRASTFHACGGLLEFTVGSADRHFAAALLGRAEHSIPPGMPEAYRKHVLSHQKAVTASGARLTHVDGSIRHLWHGSLKNRQYMKRWLMLKQYEFGPHFMERQQNGLLLWSDAAPPEFRAAVHQYFVNRSEDARPGDGSGGDDDNDGPSGDCGDDAQNGEAGFKSDSGGGNEAAAEAALACDAFAGYC